MRYDEIKQRLKKAAQLVDTGDTAAALDLILDTPGVTKNDVDNILTAAQKQSLFREMARRSAPPNITHNMILDACKAGPNGAVRCTIDLQRGETAWNPASTKDRHIRGPATVTYAGGASPARRTTTMQPCRKTDNHGIQPGCFTCHGTGHVPTVAEARKAFDAARRTLIEAVHAALVARYRAANPTSRAVSIIRYERNGGTAKRRECVLCGETGPGWCGKYPRTVASQRWEREHIEHHVREEIGGVL